MCGLKQTDSILEIWGPLCSLDFDKAVFALLTGYIDESYTGENEPVTFGLCCVYAPFKDWFWIENGWRKVIEAKNADLATQGRKSIKRYHSKEISNYEEPFDDWNNNERSEFTSYLLSHGINGNFIQSYTLTANLKQVAEDWPRVKFEGVQRFGYHSMLRMIMLKLFELIPPVFGSGAHISLIHERCEFDGVLLDAFNHFLKAASPERAAMFTSITPMGWERCTPLQVADFCAYESMKDVHRLRPEEIRKKARGRRKSLAAFLDMPSTGGICEEIPRHEILRWKEQVEKRDRLRGKSHLNEIV